MSVCDILSSSPWFLILAVPEIYLGRLERGTKQTCNAFFTMHVWPVLLAGHYDLEERIPHIEPWMHFVAICSALITGVARLALDLE
jgi:hypothetical protein